MRDKKLPLVSVLIPSYNRPKLLEKALISVLSQTYKNIEIIICDDSTNDEVQKLMVPFLKNFSNIKYQKNQQNLFLNNWQKCFQLANGEYINFLMDDDVFHVEKIEKMMSFFLKYEDVTLVTSYRKLIDELGNFLPPILATQCLYDETKILEGRLLGNYVLTSGINFIGEGTTVLFKRKDLTEKFGKYRGKEYCCINDVASWMTLLAKGKAVYISEPLSYFRIHPLQNSRNQAIVSTAIYEWLDLIVDSRKDGFLKSNDLYKAALYKQMTNMASLNVKNNQKLKMKRNEVINRINLELEKL